MKITKLFATLAVFGSLLATTAACGGSSNQIVIWVGEESLAFYQQVCNEYLEAHPDFKFKVKVVGQDTGSAAGTILQDASAAADIFTVAHDNIGKLVAAKDGKPITNEALLAQLQENTDQSYLDVCTFDGKLYGVPYISQALFLMYNKAKVTDEEAKTFEGLKAAAARAGSDVKGWTVSGSDGFNNSYTLLARKESDKSTSLKLYKDGKKDRGSCWVQGDDQVASVKWAQKMAEDPNGFTWPSTAKWPSDLLNGKALSVIGGAWHVKSFMESVGASNAGFALIPTYTLDADTAYGTATAGTVMRGGTFADVKVFMINGKSKANKYVAEQELITYLSSKEIQDRSFIACDNVPCYNSFDIEAIKAANPDLPEKSVALAKVQVGMTAYGIPQPFRTGTLNTYYYSKGGPELYKTMIDKYDTSTKTSVFTTDADIVKGLYRLQHIWQHANDPKDDVPATLPADID